MKITEVSSAKIQYVESEGALRLHFAVLQAGKPTSNGHVYGGQILQKAADEFNAMVAKKGPGTGFPAHPKPGQEEVSNVSHLVDGFEVDEDGKLWAKVRILPTRAGHNLGVLLKNGAKVGVSARGQGDVGVDGKVENYRLQGVDFTLEPAAGFVVDQSHIYESAALDEEHEDLCRLRYDMAVRHANFRGDYAAYRQIFQKLVEEHRAVNPGKEIGENNASFDSLDEAVAGTLGSQFFIMDHDESERRLMLFNKNTSEVSAVAYDVSPEGRIVLKGQMEVLKEY